MEKEETTTLVNNPACSFYYLVLQFNSPHVPPLLFPNHTQLEQQGMAPAEGLTVDDPAFLMEAMEARQAAEDTDDPRVLRTMLDENAETQRGIEKELSAACAGGRWEEAQQLVWRLTYVVRVAEAIVDKL